MGAFRPNDVATLLPIISTEYEISSFSAGADLPLC